MAEESRWPGLWSGDTELKSERLAVQSLTPEHTRAKGIPELQPSESRVKVFRINPDPV